MHDFGKLVYMDLHKTGSTYVSRFLNEACVLPMVREVKHGRVGRKDYDPGAFYFISVRHPESIYRSLFRYGLDGRGGLFENLSAAGHAALYADSSEAYNRWASFLLNEANAGYLQEGYAQIAGLYDVGLLSHRYLMLSIASPVASLRLLRWRSQPLRALQGRKWTGDLIAMADEAGFIDAVVRQESLRDDLRELATVTKPEFFDQAKVTAFLADDPSVNASKKGEQTPLVLNAENRSRIEHKERLLYRYYPDETGAAKAA